MGGGNDKVEDRTNSNLSSNTSTAPAHSKSLNADVVSTDPLKTSDKVTTPVKMSRLSEECNAGGRNDDEYIDIPPVSVSEMGKPGKASEMKNVDVDSIWSPPRSNTKRRRSGGASSNDQASKHCRVDPDKGACSSVDIDFSEQTAKSDEHDPDSEVDRLLSSCSSSSLESDDNGNAWTDVPKKKKNIKRPNRVQSEQVDFPVILEDLNTGTKRFKQYGQFTSDLFHAAGIAPIKRQRLLASGKWLISCASRESQLKLSKKTKLGPCNVKCYIPSKVTVGVIKPVPLEVDVNKIKQGNPSIVDVKRLNLRGGEPSQAVKVVFSVHTLPNHLVVGNELMQVEPFVEQVRRCTKCQKLGHTKERCMAKNGVCSRCGQKAHAVDPQENIRKCTGQRYCINCKKEGHSSAWSQCPMLQVHRQAQELKAKSGMSVSEAVKIITNPPRCDTTSNVTSNVTVGTDHKNERAAPGGVSRKLLFSDIVASRCNSENVPGQNKDEVKLADETQCIKKDEGEKVQNQNLLTLLAGLETKLCSFMSATESRMAKLEEATTHVAERVVDKIQAVRKEQVEVLRNTVGNMREKNPIAREIGLLFHNAAEAVVLGRPEALIEHVAGLYVKATGKTGMTKPQWNSELQYIGDLAMGLSTSQLRNG